MKKIEAIIRHYKLDDVKDALCARGLLHGMTVGEALGFGDQRGREITYRGSAYVRPFVPRLKVEMVVSDDDAPAIVDCIFNAAYTGEIGDGKILVSTVDRVFRIRTGKELHESVVSRPLSVAGTQRLLAQDHEQLTTDAWPLTTDY